MRRKNRLSILPTHRTAKKREDLIRTSKTKIKRKKVSKATVFRNQNQSLIEKRAKRRNLEVHSDFAMYMSGHMCAKILTAQTSVRSGLE